MHWSDIDWNNIDWSDMRWRNIRWSDSHWSDFASSSLRKVNALWAELTDVFGALTGGVYV